MIKYSPINSGEPFSEERTRKVVDNFYRDGFAYIPGVLDPQCWHRGAPNTSDRTRYLMQSQYAVEWAFHRFGWMNRVPVPEKDLRTSNERLLQVLGRRRP